LLTKIKAVAAEYPAGEPLKVDSDCRKGASVSDLSAGAVPRTTAAIPDGVYRVQISTDEVLAAGLDNHDGTSGTWTMSVRRGRFEVRCQPFSAPGEDCGGSTQSEPFEWGALRGKTNVVYFVSDNGEPPVAVRWTFKSGELRFSNPDLTRGWERVLKPWQKIE
jgi:hypothetical protein